MNVMGERPRSFVPDSFEPDADPWAYGDRSKLPQRPTSAEDFTPPQPSGIENAMSAVAGLGRSTIGAIPGVLSAAGDLALSSVNRGAAERTADRVRGMGQAQVDQFRKAGDRGMEALRQAGGGDFAGAFRTGNEAVARGLAGALPLVGPAAANIGEGFETDPYGAAGEGAGLLFMSSPSAMMATGRGVVRGATATGRGAATLASHPEFGTAVGSAVGANVGGPLGAVAGGVTGRSLSAILKRVIDEVKNPHGIKDRIADKQRMVDDLEAVMRQKANAPPSPNAGGTLVRQHVPSAEQQMATALAEIPSEMPVVQPRRITLPPQPDLPPGYTPRTTVPKPKPTAPTAPSAPTPKPNASMGPRDYFLRDPPPAPDLPPPMNRPITEADLPASWRGRTGQNVGSLKGQELKAVAEGLREVMDETGVSVSEAVNAVARNGNLSRLDREQLMQALTTMRPRRTR